MDKLQTLANKLQTCIDFATEHNEDFEASSWNYQEGVLLNHNEAKSVVELIKNLTIPVVSKSVVCGNCDGYGYTVDENGRRKEHCKECE
jgi:DnaJ-class molecular chaperone